MKKYSILIVGIECYSGHIRELIVNLKKKNPQVDISLIVTKMRDEFKTEIAPCVNQITMVKRYQGKVKARSFVAVMNTIYLLWGFIKLYFKGRFDIVDIHFAKGQLKYVMPIIKRMTNNIVITPWGSDVMRVETKKGIKELSKIYSQARYVTVGSSSQIGKCVISKFKVNPEKMVKLGWGGEFFDFIRDNSNKVTTETAKARFGLDNRFVITCGYNTQREQRHEEIVDAIYEVKEMLPKNLTLLFPFTYARSKYNEQYTKTIIEKSKAKGFDVVVVDEHLDLMDLLKLRMATDVFVHVQTTDAGSRCVMEYVMCNKKIVHGAWNKYAYLEEHKPSCYFPVEKMDDLGSVIVEACKAEIKDLPQEVKDHILDRGWSNRINRWNNFFESLVS